MSALEVLLDVQAHDTRLDQLAHRRASLPEREAVAAVAAAQAAVDEEGAPLRERRDELAREQKRIEDEAASVEAHAQEVHDKLYGGKVTAIRELQDLQADHDSLKRRQRELEDQVIELMEAIEPIDEQLAALAERRAGLDADADAAAAALAAAEAVVDAEADAVRDERSALLGGVPAGLLDEYERLRARLGGIGVARLVGSNCTGCHLALPSMELDRIRGLAADDLVHCEECGRILVR